MSITTNPANDPPIASKVGLGVEFKLVVAGVGCDIDVVNDDTPIVVLVKDIEVPVREKVDFVLDRTWDDVRCDVELQAGREQG